jgi:UDPglucose 6-dehydrogenase
MLLAEGAHVQTYDPEAQREAKKVLGRALGVSYFKNAYDALSGADFLVLATEWHFFRNPDFDRMKKLMKSPVVFDGRNQYDPAEMKSRGFVYVCVGRCQQV